MIVEHIAWQVQDPVAVAAWYTEHLGFRVVRRGKSGVLAHFLADESGRTVIEIYNNPKASIPEYPGQSPLILHLAFAVPDVAAELQRLKAAGATVVDEPSITHAGDELAMLRDPWGFPLQLVKRVEPLL
jgi:catechol 2,3-dioxygenase-like lactoylglutathione lyase family enzyme